MSSVVPPPVPDGLDPGLRPLYEEAIAVAELSPSAACALLRLVLRALVLRTGQPGRDLRRDLESATMGAPGVLRALDAIAMTDESSRRPGEIDLSQGHSDVQNLVVLVAVVVGHLGGGGLAR